MASLTNGMANGMPRVHHQTRDPLRPSARPALPVCSSRLSPGVPGSGMRQRRRGTAAVVCALGDNSSKEEAARKALQDALSGKSDVFKKWDEEAKEREGGGGNKGGGGRGRGWGSGGGGGGGGGNDPSANNEGGWEDTKQTVYAVAGIAAILLVCTQGLKMVAFLANSVLFILRALGSLGKLGSKQQSEEEEFDDGQEEAEEDVSAEDQAKRKWGSN